MIQKISIEEFIRLSRTHPILDVRSPGEYLHAHIPGAYNLPLFTDEERKVVGTLYKQQGREQAIKAGLNYFGPKMTLIVDEVEQLVQNFKTKIQNPNPEFPIPNPQSPIPNQIISNSKFQIPLLLHCWRGGMRSAGVAWLLDLYGFKVYTLSGGYKAWRNWVLQQFSKPWPLQVIGGYTGSGKTRVLHELADAGHFTIDLEGIACHKGSAFGALGHSAQPTQEMFENTLARSLDNVAAAMTPGAPIFIEDESQRIGLVNLPGVLWKTMRAAPVYFLDIPFEERLSYITAEYGLFPTEQLLAATTRIQKRLGGLNTKNAVTYLNEGNVKEAFRILLRYYDKYYAIGLYDRDILEKRLSSVLCRTVDAITNTKILLAKTTSDGITNPGN